jgi:predicted AAA+ superfamily ATPase
VLRRALRGGYPNVIERKTERLRQLWLESYVTTLINRDVREIGNVRDLKDFPVLLNALAIRSGTLLNLSDISRTVGISHETLRRYKALLETLWLFVELPAWSSNLARRLVRTPKITLSDTGLMAGLLNLDERRLHREPVYLGQLLESFAVMELRKQLGWSETRAGMFHFRDSKGAEVDVILESPAGEIVGIEVKATMTPARRTSPGCATCNPLLETSSGAASCFTRAIRRSALQRISSPCPSGLCGEGTRREEIVCFIA